MTKDNLAVRAAKTAGVVALAAGVGAATSYISTKLLMKLAMDRTDPEKLEEVNQIISGFTADNAFFQYVDEKSKELAAVENETVSITSHDGLSLVGHFIPAEDPERIIIAVHGWRSSWHRDFGPCADTWKNNHCSVLYIEQRGQNNSEGDYIGFGLTERYDVLDWVNWVITHFDEADDPIGARHKDLPIYLSGVSMGATTVLMAAGLGLPDRVHGISADCGFTSPQAIWKHVVTHNLHLPYGISGEIADSVFREKLDIGSKDYSTTEALSGNTIPVLLIHGTEDHFVPVEMTYENYKAAAGPKRLFIVPGADHGMSYYLEKEQYEETVRRFWAEFDHPEKKEASHA